MFVRMDGLLIIDKPQGKTSHDVVAQARRLLREKRIGHAGTLDPMATGVLVLCVGQATRLSEYLLGEDKGYDGVIKLGERTNTDDAEGEVIATRPVPDISEETLRALERKFTGEIEQVPPQFSAIQKGGVRAYALARKGETVELEARRVVVRQLGLEWGSGAVSVESAGMSLHPQPSTLHLRATCASGTYIRSLARDIGEVLGCGGHLTVLRRTRAGQFALADAVTLDALEVAAREDRASELLLPMDKAVGAWPAVALVDERVRKLRHGQMVHVSDPILSPEGERRGGGGGSGLGELVRVYDARRVFIAVGKLDNHRDATTLTPIKVFDV
jgi:tRNA pseudouridine55 synthase